MKSADERYTKKEASTLGRTMCYVEEGTGDPIVFLHGNPSYAKGAMDLALPEITIAQAVSE